MVGAAAGVVGGWKMRTVLDGCHNDCAEIAVLGAALGSTLLTPLAVHLTDGRQGNFGYSLLASAGIAVLGFGAVSLVAPDVKPLVWTTGVAIPLAQILSSVKIERMTAAANR